MSGCGCGCGGGESCACRCSEHRLVAQDNRAGLGAISVRLGDYRDFFGDAIRCLSDATLPALGSLGTRELSDPAIAWLDAWAVAADVLTFYRERLTNDSYLRTAHDERTLRELAALVGYKPRPGVAAIAHLAYLMEANAKPVEIPAGAKTQTVPGPGEQMQTFETDEPFVAHADWSQMAPRLTKPAGIPLPDALTRPSLRLAGTALVVQPGERVLFVYGTDRANQVAREVASARIDIVGGYTELRLKPRFPIGHLGKSLAQATELVALRDAVIAAALPVSDGLLMVIASFFLGGSAKDAKTLADRFATETTPPPIVTQVSKKFEEIANGIPAPPKAAGASALDGLLPSLQTRPFAQLSSGRQLTRRAGKTLSLHGPDRLATLDAITPGVGETLAAALDRLPVSAAPLEQSPDVLLLRASANSFAAFAPPHFTGGGNAPDEHSIENADRDYAFLDAEYRAIHQNSYVIMDAPAGLLAAGAAGPVEPARMLQIHRVVAAQSVARRAYDLSLKSTRLELTPLDQRPIAAPPVNIGIGMLIGQNPQAEMRFMRSLLFHAQSEPVTLFGDEIGGDIGGPNPEDRTIALQIRVDGLQPGQWVIVAGERTDIRDANGTAVPGVRGAELAMIAGVEQQEDTSAPADTLHTVITLDTALAYTYKRATTTLYGNVVKASHGEKVDEVVGSGDASRAGQRFALKRGPMTFTTASTPTGAESSEIVRVNGLRYQRVESLLDAGPATRAYAVDLDAGGLATLTFGDGTRGARLPSGSQNVRVQYRVGIGTPGNVRAEQISLLTDRPLGVSGVINPLRAGGGADRDTAERIRQNIPIATRGLSQLARLVSVEDYANFARRFAGIGQADAVRISDGAQQIVYVTVAGVNDAPLDPKGELLQNLRTAFAAYGDPTYPVEIGVRDLKVLVIEARVAVTPEVDWDGVEPMVRARLNDTFGFDRRRLGQPSYLSEAVKVIQTTPGVAWVDVDRFGGITESDLRNAAALANAVKQLSLDAVVLARRAGLNPQWQPGQNTSAQPRFAPSQLVRVLPAVRGLVALNHVPQEN